MPPKRAQTMEELLNASEQAVRDASKAPAPVQLTDTAHEEAIEARRIDEQSRREDSDAKDRAIELLQQQMAELRDQIVKIGRQSGQTAAINETLESQEEESLRLRMEQYKKLGMVTLLIHPNADPKQNFPIPVTIDNTQWVLKRNQPYTVPWQVVEVLEHAKSKTHMLELDPSTEEKRMVEHSYHRFPFSVLNLDQAAQVAHGATLIDAAV